MTLRMSEIYVSVQGEGLRVGIPTIFVRFGGCNLRCPGWPCDTQHAIDPKYRDEWKKTEPLDVVNRVLEIKGTTGARNICFTGGEPLLQRDDSFKALVGELRREDVTMECFSNGTLAYPAWATAHLSFTMDWKLPSSGEDPNNKVRLQNLKELEGHYRGMRMVGHSVKFVIGDRADFDMAEILWREYLFHREQLTVFAGVVWDKLDASTLVEWILERRLPWRLNVQTHNFIWPPNERAR